MSKLSHRQLENAAIRWLNAKGCKIVRRDLAFYNPWQEQPDVFGINSQGFSIMVECKTSLNDLRKDKLKYVRRLPALGMGDYRYLCVQSGAEWWEGNVPQGWGVLQVGGLHPKLTFDDTAIKPMVFPPTIDGIRAERAWFLSVIRRMKASQV